MADQVISNPLRKVDSVFHGFEVYSEVLTGSSTTAFATSPLIGFTGDKVLLGSITSAGNMSMSANKVFLEISLDGTNWVKAKDGVVAAFSSATKSEMFTIDATGIEAPYYRIGATVTSYSNDLTIEYCVKKG